MAAPASPFYTISHAQYVQCQSEIKMHLYLRQVVVGAGQNQEVVVDVKKPPVYFGQTGVNDWTVLDAPNPNAKIVARAKGLHMQADLANQGWYMSFNMQFLDDKFKGSTFQVMGIFEPAGQWSIVGGTGEFAMARGTIDYKIIEGTPDVESIRELDIHALYTPKSPQAVQGTVTTVNATSQSA